MSVQKDIEISQIYKKFGEWLQANPNAIKDSDIPESADRHTQDMIKIHVYHAKNAVKQQKEIDELRELIGRMDQLEKDIAYLDEVKANKE